jgi:hypothetical protein
MKLVKAVFSDRSVIPSHDQLTPCWFCTSSELNYDVPAASHFGSLSRTSVQHFGQSPSSQGFRTMAPQQNQFQVPKSPNVQFRVLIIGRANAGKTSILQRVCDTTESPKIYEIDQSGHRSQVCFRSWWHPQSHRLVRFNLNLQLRWDSHILVGDG